MQLGYREKTTPAVWKIVLLVLCAFLLLQGPLMLDARAYLCALPWQRTLQPPRWQGVHMDFNLINAAAFFQRFSGKQAAALAGSAPDWNDASGTYTRRAGQFMAMHCMVDRMDYYSDGLTYRSFRSALPCTAVFCSDSENGITLFVQGDARQTLQRGLVVDASALLVAYMQASDDTAGSSRPVLLFYTELPLVRAAN